MVRNLRLTHPIDTESECPPLDSSLSGGESTTPSPSSSFSDHDTAMDSSMAWSQDLSSRSPVSLVQFPVPSSSKGESMLPQMDVLTPQANYACPNMLDGMASLGDGSDLIDCNQMLIEHGLPAVYMNVDRTDYHLTPYDYSFQQNMAQGLEISGLPGAVPTPESNPCFSQQMFSGAEALSGCPPRPEADPYLTASLNSLPRTVVPSQTITEPMTPCSGRGQSFCSPIKAEVPTTPLDSVMEYGLLMAPTPDHSPVSSRNSRMSALRLHERLAAAVRVPSGRPRSSRTTKRGAPLTRKTLDERTPLIVERKDFDCTHPDCNKPGIKKKSFGRREHLKRHEKSVHSREKPYHCIHCDIRFSRSDNYNSHRITHAIANRKNGRNDFFAEDYEWHQKKLKNAELKRSRRKLEEY